MPAGYLFRQNGRCLIIQILPVVGSVETCAKQTPARWAPSHRAKVRFSKKKIVELVLPAHAGWQD
jgi:hypothetical protein